MKMMILTLFLINQNCHNICLLLYFVGLGITLGYEYKHDTDLNPDWELNWT